MTILDLYPATLSTIVLTLGLVVFTASTYGV